MPSTAPRSHPHSAQVSGLSQPATAISEQGGLPLWRLGKSLRNGGPGWWFLSCHGGAGATTLNNAIQGGMDAGRYWPVPDPPAYTNVVLVARSHAGGLTAAQLAARQWASGSLPTVRVLGLAVVADAPGRRPKVLRDLQGLIAGGVPRVWDLPWIEELRLGAPVSAIQLPAAFTTMAVDLQTFVTGGSHA